METISYAIIFNNILQIPKIKSVKLQLKLNICKK